MSRKEKDVTVTDRGTEKTFYIKEMPARQAEAWANRAFLALAHSAVDFPPGIERAGMAEIAQVAHLFSGVRFPELEPLLDELLGCVMRVPDPTRLTPLGRPVMFPLKYTGSEMDDIEDVATAHFLRREVVSLHTNFTLAGLLLNLLATTTELTALPASSPTRTSRRRSARLSQAA